MATTARAFILSRVTDLSPKPHQPYLPRLTPQPPHPSCLTLSSRRHATVSCLSSGGEVSDEFVSTRKSNLDRGFSVIANLLKRVEPLDNSLISSGVSDCAKDSMKQTISTMLGLLPSDHFSVTVRVSMVPLYRLLFSSVITGYTLWNAEYRMSLTRNLNVSMEGCKRLNSLEEEMGEISKESKGGAGTKANGGNVEVSDKLEVGPQIVGDLSPEALNYIQQLQSELSDAEKELSVQKQENARIEFDRGHRNDLLEYLRSLDPDMVMIKTLSNMKNRELLIVEELSRPSSMEVEDIIHQLVGNALKTFFGDKHSSNFTVDRALESSSNQQDCLDEFCETVGTSRDYLAKLLFWCMLLGHHLRGLENRLHLACVVGLL